MSMSNHTQNIIVYANPDKCIGCKKCEMACVSAHINIPYKEAKKRGLPVRPPRVVAPFQVQGNCVPGGHDVWADLYANRCRNSFRIF